MKKKCKHFLIVIIEICVHVWISFVYLCISFRRCIRSLHSLSRWVCVCMFVFFFVCRFRTVLVSLARFGSLEVCWLPKREIINNCIRTYIYIVHADHFCWLRNQENWTLLLLLLMMMVYFFWRDNDSVEEKRNMACLKARDGLRHGHLICMDFCRQQSSIVHLSNTFSFLLKCTRII